MFGGVRKSRDQCPETRECPSSDMKQGEPCLLDAWADIWNQRTIWSLSTHSHDSLSTQKSYSLQNTAQLALGWILPGTKDKARRIYCCPVSIKNSVHTEQKLPQLVQASHTKVVRLQGNFTLADKGLVWVGILSSHSSFSLCTRGHPGRKYHCPSSFKREETWVCPGSVRSLCCIYP